MAEGETAIEAADFSGATQALETALEGLQEMKSGFPFLAYLKPLPWVGDQLRGGEAVVDVSIETVEVVLTGVQIAADVFETLLGADSLLGSLQSGNDAAAYSDLSQADKRQLLLALAGSLPELREVQVRLQLAQADLDRLSQYNLSEPLQKAIDPLYELLPELATVVDIFVPLASIAPEFGGLESNRQFLILFLNNAELRPGGGFIGVYSLVEVRDGEIINMSTADSYSVDAFVEGKSEYHVNPPPPLVSYLNQPSWYFRDAAWSPDFSETAQIATTLMRQEISFGNQPVPQIDGVIGITPTFVAKFLDLVGPITVSGVTFTSENLAVELEHQVEQAFVEQGIPLEQRKGIVSLLGDALLHELFTLPTSSWLELFDITESGVEGKEFALMSFEPKVQAALEDSGWAGVINPAGADDVLLVADANLAALKTDLVVDREVNYSLKRNGSGYRATTSIAYKHEGSFDWMTTRYRTYTRVYAPLGSTLVASAGSMKDDKTRNPGLLPGQVKVEEELGMTSFGAFIAIEPGETGTLSFTYDLPANVVAAIDRGTYRFLALKQLGAGDNLLTLNLDFGTALVSATPGEEPEDFGDEIYHVTTELNTDKLFTVRFK
mgnify:FL=1